MPGIDRTQLVLGPGHLLFGGAVTGTGDSVAWTPTNTLFCKKLDAKVVTKWENVEPAGYGRRSRRKVDETVTIKVTSAGGFNAAVMAFLWPYGATAMGASIFGSSDTPIGINSMAGQQLIFWNAAITKMPSLYLGADKMLYGDFEITAIIRKSLARSDVEAIFSQASVAFSALTMPKPVLADFVRLPTVATWGTGTPEVIQAQKGWQIDFPMQLDWRMCADHGTFDARYQTGEVTAKCLPMNYGESRLADLKVQGTGADVGLDSRVQADLTLVQGAAAGGGLTLVLKNAAIDDVAMQYGDNLDRVPELVMLATRDFSTGYGNLFTLVMT